MRCRRIVRLLQWNHLWIALAEVRQGRDASVHAQAALDGATAHTSLATRLPAQRFDASPCGAVFLLIGQLQHAVLKVSLVNH